MSSLRERLRKDCLGLLDSLSALKRSFRDENTLLHKLALFNRSYLGLISKAEYKMPLSKLETIRKEAGLEKLRCKESGFCVVVSKEHGVLSVSTGNVEINAKILQCMRTTWDLKDLGTLISLYIDYKHRRCDACLRVRDFNLRYTTERVVDGDYVLAYHSGCLEK